MSRLSNALIMYMLLQGRRLMKVQELADILKVSPRMIKGYRINEKELDALKMVNM